MTDTPTDRAALEALADRLARHSIGKANELEDDLLEAVATLRALASRADPPADVAHLLSEAERIVVAYEAGLVARLPVQHPGTMASDGVSMLIRQMISALVARAEPPGEEGAKPRMDQGDNVAGLVEEARGWESTLAARAERIGKTGVVDCFEKEDHYHELAISLDLITRLAAALTAQAERAEQARQAYQDLLAAIVRAGVSDRVARALAEIMQERDGETTPVEP